MHEPSKLDLGEEIVRLRRECNTLQGRVDKAQSLHRPVTVEWSDSPKCSASHGVAWVNWPCPDAIALGLGGEATDA